MAEEKSVAPKPPLFHYCSNASFLAIIASREIVTSALSLSNDTMEGKWIEHIFSNLCAADVDLAKHQAKLVDIFGDVTKIFGGLGFCLSEVGDLLSQWRGYAEDGTGVSIGFNPDYFAKLAQTKTGVSLEKVIYAPSEQEAALSSLLEEIKGHVERGALNSMFGGLLYTPSEDEKKKIGDASAALWMSMVLAFSNIYKFKNPAFSEEKEWRLLTYLVNSQGQMAVDALGDVDFRAKGDRVVPIKKIKIVKLDVPAISEVVLGPKNITPDIVVTAALSKAGFANVKISRSSATYR